MNSLPDELLAHIFSFLPPHDLSPCYQLSKRVRNALTTFHRRIQRPIADVVRITLQKVGNEVRVTLLVLCGYDRYYKNKQDYFICSGNELLVRWKYESVLCDFGGLEEAGEFVRQKVGSLAEALEIALGWVTFKMFVEKLKIVADKDTLTPEIARIIVENARKICDEEKYPAITLHLKEDLSKFHADFINNFSNWRIRLRADSYPLEVFQGLDLGRVCLTINVYNDANSFTVVHMPVQKPDEYVKFVLQKLIRERVDISEFYLWYRSTRAVFDVASQFNMTVEALTDGSPSCFYEFHRGDQVYQISLYEDFLHIENENHFFAVFDLLDTRSVRYLS